MSRLNFIVEGATEEAFVKDILTPYLSARGVYPSVRLIQTSRHGARIFRGGMISYDKARKDILRWLKQDTDSYLTTMFDYYALPQDFPGVTDLEKNSDLFEKVNLIQTKMSDDINNNKFIPYIQLHEFEALLFSDVQHIDDWMELYDQKGKVTELHKIRDSFESPEHINNSYETTPSKRLKSIYPSYDKVSFGSFILKDIGIEKLQQECKHFRQWLTTISNLGA